MMVLKEDAFRGAVWKRDSPGEWGRCLAGRVMLINRTRGSWVCGVLQLHTCLLTVSAGRDRKTEKDSIT